jgi:hypothetical protein
MMTTASPTGERGTAFDRRGGRYPTLEQMMADRNQSEPGSRAKTAPPSSRDDAPESERDDIEKNPEPDANRSTASRPRGHTEEPDRTL